MLHPRNHELKMQLNFSMHNHFSVQCILHPACFKKAINIHVQQQKKKQQESKGLSIHSEDKTVNIKDGKKAQIGMYDSIGVN